MITDRKVHYMKVKQIGTIKNENENELLYNLGSSFSFSYFTSLLICPELLAC